MKLESLDFEDLDRFRIRLVILGGVVILIFSLLASRLWYLQISQGELYTEFSQGNRIRLISEVSNFATSTILRGIQFYAIRSNFATKYCLS